MLNFFIILLTAETILACSNDWTIIDNNCYKAFTSEMSFDKAKSTCEKYESELISNVNKEVAKFLKNNGKFKQRIWLGGEKIKNQWKWKDGTAIPDNFWARGQPDHKNDENCLVLVEKQGLHDFPCRSPRKLVPWYICQKGQNSLSY